MFKNYHYKILVGLLLVVMFVLALMSLRNDSATMDEVAHIPAGYSYLKFQDMRLNPEHPPLLKDLSAVPLLFLDLSFPQGHPSWTTDVNGQWSLGPEFLYGSGNNADQIIFWSRLPFLLLMVLLGIYIFKWTKELFGPKAGLLALFFYSLSPTFLAHSRLVTTDLGAAAAFFIATYYFIKFLKNPCKKNLIIAGIVFGLAQLVKFSLFLLVPFFVILTFVYFVLLKKRAKGCLPAKSVSEAERAWLERSERARPRAERRPPRWGGRPRLFAAGSLSELLVKLILIFIIGFLLIWPVYQFHVLNYPIEKQQRDIEFILQSNPWTQITQAVHWMAGQPILRPYAQYLLGLFMVAQRASGGHTTFFLGEVSAAGWWYYFPVVYAIKVPLAFHLLCIIALFFLAWQIKKPFWINPLKRTTAWIREYFPEFSMFVFMAIYWALSIKSNLNIGVRHILPFFPFMYVLVSGQITRIIKNRLMACGLGLLLFLYLISNFSIYPHYLAYFNELVGGSKNGYKYVVDSNLDWGQDLKRLAQFVDKNNINSIRVDYFGGGSPEYYLNDKFIPWNSDKGRELGWLAVSATFLQSGNYQWLKREEPVEVIGYSIFVYHL